QAYNELVSKVGDKDVALSILNHVAKDRRTVEINNAKKSQVPGKRMDPYGPPTPNQQGLLRRLGIPIPSTAGEASGLIDKAKGK
ncbi:MAG: hypothetical protein V1755_07725, partial [Chloroflexota bacterium]